MEFKSLETEVYREYSFPDGSKVRIEAPKALNVSASGGHRIEDCAGLAHYIPAGWNHLTWQVKLGLPAFAF